MKNKPKKTYLYWNDEDPEYAFWQVHDSILELLGEHGDGADVYVAEPKFLGMYERRTSAVKANPDDYEDIPLPPHTTKGN